MSALSTKQRRARVRRRRKQKMLALNAQGAGVLHYDPWGRLCGMGTWVFHIETGRGERILARTRLPNGYFVSTVWDGLDHAFGAGPPLIYESGVFRPTKKSLLGLQLDGDRYSTRRAAHEGHRALVEKWRAKPKLEVLP